MQPSAGTEHMVAASTSTILAKQTLGNKHQEGWEPITCHPKQKRYSVINKCEKGPELCFFPMVTSVALLEYPIIVFSHFFRATALLVL